MKSHSAADARPNQLQKRVLPALFHLRCPSRSHQRSARGRTRLTTVISSCSDSYCILYNIYTYICVFRTGVFIVRFRIKDFRIKRRFSFPVLQVNSSLVFTILDVSCTNSEFFFTCGPGNEERCLILGDLIQNRKNTAPVRNSLFFSMICV